MPREPLSLELRRAAKISLLGAVMDEMSTGSGIENLRMLQSEPDDILSRLLDRPIEQLQLYIRNLHSQDERVVDDDFKEVDMGDDTSPGPPNHDTAGEAENSPLIVTKVVRLRRTISVEEAGIDPPLIERLDSITDAWIDLGEKFLAAAEDGDPERLEALAAQGAPVNYHDPRNGATALHYVAAQGARRAFRVLMKTGKCDFLARDDEGRLVSEMAGAYGRDLVMERLLLMKEIKQARQTGVPLDHIYRRDLSVRPAPPSLP